jgi:hypothetical protein
MLSVRSSACTSVAFGDTVSTPPPMPKNGDTGQVGTKTCAMPTVPSQPFE